MEKNFEEKKKTRQAVNNYAFIDSQNVNYGFKYLKKDLDWKRFRIYLTEKYKVSKAFLFIGYVENNTELYNYLYRCGYELVFKPITTFGEKIKGNRDADLVLKCVLEKDSFDRAIIVTSDGDFYSLVKYLYESNKLLCVLSPYFKTCSKLLKKEVKEKIFFLNNIEKVCKSKSTA